MRVFWACIAFVSALICFVPDAQSQQLVRVRLMTLEKSVQISGMGLRFQNLAQPFRPVAIPQAGQVEVRLLQKDGKNFWSLRLNHQEHENLFTEKYLMIQGENLHAGAESLPPRILLAANGTKKVDLIGVVPLDDYIVGVLKNEMPTSWPLETLKAQAVAIRSYTLAVMEERQNRAYHVESSVLDQVFSHVMEGDEKDLKLKKAQQAVRETQGLKLLGPNNKTLKAFYHADCGGKTTTARNVWKSGVDAGVAVDNSCPTGPHSQWRFRLTKEALMRKLHVASLASLTLVKAQGESRVASVRVAMNDGATKTLSANEFRQMLGFQDLRSTLFEVKEEAGQIVFVGRGFGHGVGLCQWGSRVLGLQGHKFQEILKHYYPLAKLR